MADAKKLTPEQLDNINNIRNTYYDLITRLGQVEFDRTAAEQHVEQLFTAKMELTEELRKVIDQEQKLVDDLNTEYGTGLINIEAGTFTPNE